MKRYRLCNITKPELTLLVFLTVGLAGSCMAGLPVPVKPQVIELTGPVTDRRAEVSGLTWWQDQLVILPQHPDIFGDDGRLGFFTLAEQQISDFLKNPQTGPLTPSRIECIAPGLTRVIKGFDGLEAVGVLDSLCFFTIEAKEDTGMAGYLVSGRYDNTDDFVRMDMTRLAAIPMGLNIGNIAEESLIIDNDRIITMCEANGKNISPHPVAKAFDRDLRYIGPVPFPTIEYRVTDATCLDKNGKFWVLNYFYPPDADQLNPAPDQEALKYGLPADHNADGCIERLLELELTAKNIIVRTNTPPVYLELLPAGECRNWEAVVRLDNRGFLVMTDKYPGTILAFVPYRFDD